MPCAFSVLPSLVWVNIKMACSYLDIGTSMRTALYFRNNVSLFIEILIKLTLSCNANAGKYWCLAMLVNLIKHSSVWGMLLVFWCGKNYITNIRTIYRTVSAYSAIEKVNGILNVADCTKTELAVRCFSKLH